jgi:hypothetical protein
MADDLSRLIADLKGVTDRKDILKEVRRTIRGPLPGTRKAIKTSAMRNLPSGNGLNAWVAALRITAKITLTASRVAVNIKGGRNSSGARSDIKAIDRGRVRHPSWGRRGAGQWHNQTVVPGFFTETVEGRRGEFVEAVDKGASIVVERLNRG